VKQRLKDLVGGWETHLWHYGESLRPHGVCRRIVYVTFTDAVFTLTPLCRIGSVSYNLSWPSFTFYCISTLKKRGTFANLIR
jgi:hypothetical protein